MLRKALKRPAPIPSNPSSKQTKEEPSLGQDDPNQRATKNSYEEKLEGVVFGGGEDIIEELERVSAKKTHKKKKKCVQKLNEVKPAWIDTSDEKTKSKSKSMSTPLWAKMDRERNSDREDVDSDLEDLLHRAGDVIEKSTSLPAGMIQIKRLTDANVDDTISGRLQNVEFHPTAKVILTAATTHRLSLFQIDGKNNPKIQSIFFEDFPIHTAHFTACGEEIIVGSDRKNFMYYDMMVGKVFNIPKIKSFEGNNMARFEISPDGKYLVFLGRYGAMHVLCAKSKEYITTLNMNGDVHCATFSQDSSKLYSFGSGNVFVWDMASRSCVHTFIDEGCIQGTCIAISPNNQHIACGSQSGVVNIYETETCLRNHLPTPLKAIMNLTTVCNKAKFNCTSEILAISSKETVRGIKLIQFPSMHAFANFPEMTDREIKLPKCLDFSPNGGYMAVGNHKGKALLYRLKHYSEY